MSKLPPLSARPSIMSLVPDYIYSCPPDLREKEEKIRVTHGRAELTWALFCSVQLAQLGQPKPREVKGVVKGVRTWLSCLHHNTSGIFVMFVF